MYRDKVKREDALRLDAFNKRMEKSSRAVAEFDFKAVEDASQLADKRMMNEIQRKHGMCRNSNLNTILLLYSRSV